MSFSATNLDGQLRSRMRISKGEGQLMVSKVQIFNNNVGNYFLYDGPSDELPKQQ